MEYYNSARNFQPMTQPIYNVKDMLLSGQALGDAVKGSSKLMQDNAKAQQQVEANAYVSGLLGKATPENYQQTLLQAGSMAPYASAELMNQVKDTRGQMQYDQGVATHKAERGEDITQRGVENTRAEKTLNHTIEQDAAILREKGYDRESSYEIANLNAQVQRENIREQALGRQANVKMMNDHYQGALAQKGLENYQSQVGSSLQGVNTSIDSAIANGTGLFNWASVDPDKVESIKAMTNQYAMNLLAKKDAKGKPLYNPASASKEALSKLLPVIGDSWSSGGMVGNAKKAFGY